MPFQTFFPDAVPESASAVFTCRITDHLGAPIGSGNLDALVFSLIDDRTKAFVNARNRVNCLNANGGTLGSTGEFALELKPADTALLSQTNATERRVLVLEWEWNGALPNIRKGRHEVRFSVANVEVVAS